MVVEIEAVRKVFSYINPDPNSNDGDMWISYILGLLWGHDNPFAARRAHITALDNVSFSVRDGEFFGILGGNGAGKSTLVKVIATILRPNSGTVRIKGLDTRRHASRARAMLSVVPAAGWLAFDSQLTIGENLAFWARLYGIEKMDVKSRIKTALEVVGLSDWYNETPNHLSSGMRQRLAIAKGLMFRSPLFILDEPTANIDPVSATQIRDYLRNDLNRQLGQTVLLTTHNMEEAERLCDRVVILERGKLIAFESPRKLTESLNGYIWEADAACCYPEKLRELKRNKDVIHVLDFLDDTFTGRIRIQFRSAADTSCVESLLHEYSIENGGNISLSKPRFEDFMLSRGLKKDE